MQYLRGLGTALDQLYCMQYLDGGLGDIHRRLSQEASGIAENFDDNIDLIKTEDEHKDFMQTEVTASENISPT